MFDISQFQNHSILGHYYLDDKQINTNDRMRSWDPGTKLSWFSSPGGSLCIQYISSTYAIWKLNVLMVLGIVMIKDLRGFTTKKLITNSSIDFPTVTSYMETYRRNYIIDM
jgi:hypothetical protein